MERGVMDTCHSDIAVAIALYTIPTYTALLAVQLDLVCLVVSQY